MNNINMQGMFRALGLFGLLSVAVLFQNCADPLSQFKSYGNGDPYEGYVDTPDDHNGHGPVSPGNDQQAPPDEEDVDEVPVHSIDPDRGASSEIEQGCFATNPVIHQIWTIKETQSLERYVILQFRDIQGYTREKAIHWSSHSDLSERSMIWKLDEGTEVLHISFLTGQALLTYKRNGILIEVELQCSP